ncbi:MAG TPA: hypothetical protein VLV89_11810 [Candidatus Acidoferrum sp.]|nr:hypothetical protein [Candidatus Acidoferrum sp.]
MSSRTIFLGKLIGLFCILLALSMLARRQETIVAIEGLLHDAPLMLVTGLITMGFGIAMVLSHNVWSGGALPVMVTIIGWTTLVKGLLLLFLAQNTDTNLFLQVLRFDLYFYLYVAIAFLLGAYLFYAAAVARVRQAS